MGFTYVGPPTTMNYCECKARCPRGLTVTDDELRVFNHFKAAYKLSDAEARVAALVGLGHLQREVAVRLGLSVKTIKFHVTAIYRKMKGGSARALLTEATRLTTADLTVTELYDRALREIERLKRELAYAKGIQLPLPIGHRVIERE